METTQSINELNQASKFYSTTVIEHPDRVRQFTVESVNQKIDLNTDRKIRAVVSSHGISHAKGNSIRAGDLGSCPPSEL